MPYSLKDANYDGLRIACCLMVNEAGTALVNVDTVGESAPLTEEGDVAGGDRIIYTSSRTWDGTPLAGSFEGYNGGFRSEGWNADGINWDQTVGVSCFIAINDGVNEGGGNANGYMNALQFDNDIGDATSGFGWNATRQPIISRSGLRGTSTSITLPSTGKASVGWYYQYNDDNTGYWYAPGEGDTTTTTLVDTGSVFSSWMPAYIRRVQSWDTQGNATGDLLCIVVFEGELSGTGWRDLHNDWPNQLLNLPGPPAGGYKPLLQKSDVGNSLYDGTIL